MVFGRRAHHRRSADVDVLDGCGQVTVGFGHRLFEGIEVDDDQIDRADIMGAHDHVIGTATTEDAAVHLGVQGFQSSVHHFRKAGVVRNVGNPDAVFFQQPGSAAGGQDFDVPCHQGTGEVDDAGFIGDTE